LNEDRINDDDASKKFKKRKRKKLNKPNNLVENSQLVSFHY
jgi:hypothetical protein